MSQVRGLIGAAIVVGSLFGVGVPACESQPHVAKIDRTAGLSFDFYWTDPAEGRAMRAKLQTDGTYSFAGGTSATYDDFDWSTLLTEEQITTLRTKLNAAGLRQGSGDRLGEGSCQITFNSRTNGEKCSMHGSGETPEIVEFRAYLVLLSLRRFADTMDALPKGNSTTAPK